MLVLVLGLGNANAVHPSDPYGLQKVKASALAKLGARTATCRSCVFARLPAGDLKGECQRWTARDRQVSSKDRNIFENDWCGEYLDVADCVVED